MGFAGVSLDLSLAPVVNALGSALVLLLGIWVASLKPRLRANVAFAVFAISWGWVNIVLNLVLPDDPGSRLLFATWIPAQAVATAGLVLVALWFPRRLQAGGRRLLIAPASVALVFFGMMVVVVLAFWGEVEALFVQISGARSFLLFFGVPVLFSFFAAFAFALALLPLRFSVAREPSQRRQYAFLAAALVLYPAMELGPPQLCAGAPAPACAMDQLLSQIPFLAAAALWLRSTSRSSGDDARRARNLALLMVAAPLAGAVAGASMGHLGPQYGIARIAMVFLLGYAILKHQLLGIDVKVKWGIRRGTLAAMFVGVFFVVSQVAQNALQQYGVLIGGAAAGLLLFGLSPLQRFAERVADTAMPGVKAPSQMTYAERNALYLEQAKAAWADGVISRDERFLLDRLRTSLGVTGEEAIRLESEAAKGL